MIKEINERSVLLCLEQHSFYLNQLLQSEEPRTYYFLLQSDRMISNTRLQLNQCFMLLWIWNSNSQNRQEIEKNFLVLNNQSLILRSWQTIGLYSCLVLLQLIVGGNSTTRFAKISHWNYIHMYVHKMSLTKTFTYMYYSPVFNIYDYTIRH